MTAAPTSDAIIVGAGVQGTSLAFQLARRGISVQVLESATVGAGATGRSSGFIRMHYDLETECRLAWESFRFFRDWDALVGSGDPTFVQTGFLQIFEPEHEEAVRLNVAMQQRIGIDTRIVTADDLAEIAPGLAADDVRIAAYEAQSGYADPAATASGFLQAARDAGAVFRRGTRVTAVHTAGDRVCGVETNVGRFDAPVVVLAAGAWTTTLASTVGLSIPVQTWREHTAFFVVPHALQGKFPAVIDDTQLCSFRPEGESLLLAGVEDGNEIGIPPDADLGPMPQEILERLVDRLSRRMPLMAGGGFFASQSGQDGMTPDQRPILGPAGPDGLYLLCGFSGTGFKTAPAIGICMAEMITEGRSSTVDIGAYNLRRFEDGRHLVATHAYPALWRDPALEDQAPLSD